VKNGAFLSEAINLADISTNHLNIIKAPCGCGKTQFAIDTLPQLATSRNQVLMLIDTTVGKNRILKEEGTVAYSKMWRESVLDQNYFHWAEHEEDINVMTVYAFGLLLQRDTKFINKLRVIACDEFHNAFAFREFASDATAYERAIDNLKYLSIKPDCYVVALSATPNKIDRDFDAAAQYITPTRELRSFEDKDTRHYRHLEHCINIIQPGMKCLLYIPFIQDMKRYRDILQKEGIVCEAVWSQHNTKHDMSDGQYAVLRHIVDKEVFPDDIDTLIINASCGTCININGKIDRVIVHDDDPDIVEQARGRYRNDLDILYKLDKKHIDVVSLEGYLDRPLYVEDNTNHKLEASQQPVSPSDALHGIVGE